MPFSVTLTKNTVEWEEIPTEWADWLNCIRERANAIESGSTDPLLDEEIAALAISECEELGESPPAGWSASGSGVIGSGLKQSGEGWDWTGGAAAPLSSEASEEGCEFHVVLTPTVPPIETLIASYCNHGQDSAKGVVLFFSPGRTRIESVVFENVDPRRTQASQRLFPTQCGSEHLMMFAEPVRPGGSAVATIGFVGDPPQLRKAVFLIDRSDARVPATATAFDPIPSVVDCGAIADLNVYRTSFFADLEHREELMNEQASSLVVKSPQLVDQQFFAALDRLGHPDVPAPQKDQAAIDFGLSPTVRAELGRLEPLAYHLWLRLRKRVRTVGNTGAPPFMDASQSGPERRLELLTAGRLLARLFEVFYESDRDRIGQAFERFAGGELRVFGKHGVPNGTNFFTFGELAIALSELGGGLGEERIVVDLLPVWTRAAEIYARCYHLPKGPRTIAAYTILDNPTGVRRFLPKQKAQLNLSYQQLGLTPGDAGAAAVRFSEVVTAALYDQFGGSNPLPSEFADQPPDPDGRSPDCENPCEPPRRPKTRPDGAWRSESEAAE